jgi:transposase-like protein
METKLECPECRSKNLIKYGWKFMKDKETKERVKVQRFQCNDCGRITIKPL